VNTTDTRLATDRAGIADYRFVRHLGAGNYGAFYLAHRPQRLHIDAEFLAVKVLSGSNSQDTFRRASRELSAFAAVTSPYLVTLYDAGQQSDELYYSMEYLPDGSLADAIAHPPGQVLAAVADAARAAHALHDAGIAHNDIKPGNVMLHGGHAKLSDLGLSQLLTPGLTVTGLGSAGSVEYLDPAILRGELPGRATDIYALGATLHRALTGTGTCRPTTPCWRCAGC
jgi:serine/threonine protein kinase